MRPIAVSTKLAASNSSTTGTPPSSPGSRAMPSGATDTFVSPPFLPDTRIPDGARLDVGAVGGRLPDDETERNEQVGRIAVHRVALTRALADVPRVDGVVDELGHRVEARRQRTHVLVRDEEAAPCVGVEALDDRQHLGAVLVEARDQFVLRITAEGHRARVDVLVHGAHAERVRCCTPSVGHVEAGEVALRRVDEVPDDVTHLPVPSGGRGLPHARHRRQGEQLVRLLADRSQQVVLAREVEEVPFTHRAPSRPCPLCGA